MAAITPGYFTVYEVAEKLGVSHSQVTRYVRAELLPSERLGNQILIPRQALKGFERPKRGNPNLSKK